VGLGEFAGRIGKVIDCVIEKAVELTAETRKDYNQKAILFNSSGDDSPPVKNDKLVLLKIDGTGKYVVVGIFNETQGAKPGEKIFYARDEDGAIKSKLSMLGDGSAKWELDDLFSMLAKKTVGIEAKEKAAFKGENVEIEATKKTKIKGGDVELIGNVTSKDGFFKLPGSVTPTGNGALCGCKYCYATGAPVAGDTAQGN